MCMLFVKDIQTFFVRNVAKLLLKHKVSQMEEGYQEIHVIRNSTFFRQIIDLYQDHSISIRKRPNVTFENEDGYDAGGLTRDFFSCAFQKILDPANGLFEQGCFVPTQNIQAVVSGKFHAVGRCFAHSIIHGGPSSCLSETVLSFMLGEPLSTLNIPIDLIVSHEVKKISYALQEANEDADLAEIDNVFPLLQMAGINLPLTFQNKQAITRQLAVHDVILKRLASIQAIQGGMDEIKIIELSRKYPKLMRSVLVLKDKVLDAERFLSLIAIPSHLSEEKQRVVDYLLKFLYAANEGLLKACLQFITGSSYIPPMGFHNHISLDFSEEKRLPFARTCTLQLQLSTACASYDDFEQELKLAVNEHGFYCV